MTPLITVILAGATSLLTLAIAIASERVFSGQGWLVPYLLGASVLLYLLAAILAFIHWQKERHKEKAAVPSAPLPFNQVIKQEANPQIHNTVVFSPDKPQALQRTKAQQHDYETARMTLSKLGPKPIAVLRFVRTHGEQTFGTYNPVQLPDNVGGGEMRNILDGLARCGLISRRDIQEPRNPRSIYDIALPMKTILEELLYEDGLGTY
jgi:hypothetical protein